MKRPLSVTTLPSVPRFLPFVLRSRFPPAVIATVRRKCPRRVWGPQLPKLRREAISRRFILDTRRDESG